jgi:Zn finger protein HypA/HybF involved in hydrogenase expression
MGFMERTAERYAALDIVPVIYTGWCAQCQITIHLFAPPGTIHKKHMACPECNGFARLTEEKP